MNNLSFRFTKICFFLFFFLTACGSAQPQKNSSTATSTILPVTSTVAPTTSPTATETPPPPTPIATIEMPTMIVTPAPTDRPGNYLLYTLYLDQSVLWAINPEKPSPFRLPDTSNLWNNWSPSHQFWLYSDGEWFYKIFCKPYYIYHQRPCHL